MPRLRLVSHHLCPYVQRALIVAAEKGIALERVYIDLAAKPAWFQTISPTSKVPLLQVYEDDGEHVLFESAAICEYLDESFAPPLMPASALARARHRAWIEFASGALADIAALYGAKEETIFDGMADRLRNRFRQLENAVVGPFFQGDILSLVDAAFGPVFRYLDVFEARANIRLADGLPRLAAWRDALAARPSIAAAVAADYPQRLTEFLMDRNSVLSSLIADREAA